MPDQDCQNACLAAYTSSVSTCNQVLTTNLITAQSDADRAAAREAFTKCMDLAQEVKDICLEHCQ